MAGILVLDPGAGRAWADWAAGLPGKIYRTRRPEEVLVALREEKIALVLLPEGEIQLAREIKEVARGSLVAVVREHWPVAPGKRPEVDEWLPGTDREEFLARMWGLLELREANEIWRASGEKGEDGAWHPFLDEGGFVGPGRVSLDQFVRVVPAEVFARHLALTLGSTVSLVPLEEDGPWVEYLGSFYCRAVRDSSQRKGEQAPCSYGHWLVAARAMVRGEPVEGSCPGGLPLWALPVDLTFRRLRYPLGAWCVGWPGVPPERDVWKKLEIPWELLRREVADLAAQGWHRGPLRNLARATLDYLSRDFSERYLTAFTTFVAVMRARGASTLAGGYGPEVERAEKLATIGRMAAGILHEIRNPLTSIRGFVQLVAEKRPPQDPEREYLDIVLEELDRVGDYITHFLHLAKPEQRRRTEVDLVDLLRGIMVLVESQGLLKDIEVVQEYASALPPIVADPGQIRQVLLNLIQNAFQAMPHGGRLTVRAYLAAEERMVVVDVEDTGIGIPEEHLPRLGEFFFTTKEDGTGLGLALTFRIVREHGGTIEVWSRVGQGSRFTVRLPYQVS